MENLIAPLNRLQVRFGSEGHEIDIRTLVAMLEANEKLLNRIAYYYRNAEIELNFRVSPPMEGSFLIDLWLKANGSTLKKNTREAISITADILGIASFVWMCFAQFNGEPIRSGPEKDVVTTEIAKQLPPDSTISPTTVINIYNYAPVRTSLSKAVTTAAGDVVVETIEITVGNEPTLEIAKEQMEEVRELRENLTAREDTHRRPISTISPIEMT